MKGPAMTPSRSLPQELAIYGVAELAPVWQTWLDHDPDNAALTVDASAPLDVDGAGVQLLISLANALHQRGRALVLCAPSEALQTACRRLGATFLLEPAGADTAATLPVNVPEAA